MERGRIVAERWEIEAVAGAGGMGVVHRARDRSTGERVAIKVLSAHAFDQTHRFEREARLLAELDHPAVVRYVAHGETTDGERWIATEWLEGEVLRDRLRREVLTVAEVAALARRVAGALGFAHARGVVHRDVKPANILLEGSRIERAKVIDFGIARAEDASQRTRTGIRIGTPSYMAPEQARGASEVDARADVFSLGCVLYRALTGKRAFSGEDAMAILAKILLHEVAHVSEVRPDVPPALGDLVARMLAKDPARRPADGNAIVAELERLGERALKEIGPLSERTLGLTTGEQRIVSLVLISGDAGEATTRVGEPRGEEDFHGHGAPDLDMEEAVKRHGGRYEPLADGSAVVLVSGTGSATDLAKQAARCALAIHGAAPDARLAVATGRAVVSRQSPVGEVLDRAAKIVRGAGATPIGIDDATAGLLQGSFAIGGASSGLSLDAELEPNEPPRTLLRKPTECVGRDLELGLLMNLFDEAANERLARAVLVVGASGVGKSRVRHEIVQRLRARGVSAIWTAHGDPLTAGSPFGILAQLVTAATGVNPGEPIELRRRKLRAHLGTRLDGGDLERVVEFLGEMVLVPSETDTGGRLRAARRDAMLMHDQMRRAFEDWLSAEAADRPVVLVLENHQYSDVASVKFLDAALRNVERSLIVLAFARPDVEERFRDAWAERDFRTIRMLPLGKKASETLVRQALGAAAPAEVVAKLVDHANGNAFFLEELIRAHARGRGDELPEAVLAVVQARLETLDAEARRVLRAASVLGRSFSKAGVAALLGRQTDEADVDRLLGGLVAAEVIAKTRGTIGGAAPSYAFRNALLREAAYALLTDRDRRVGHRLAAGFLVEQSGADPMVLAEHFERGEERARASEWFLAAAQQALGGNDLEGAASRADRGIAHTLDPELLGALHLVRAEAYRWLGDSGECERSAALASSMLARGSASWCSAAHKLAVTRGGWGKTDEVLAIATDLASLDPDEAAAPTYVVALAATSILLAQAGRAAASAELLARVESVTDSLSARDAAALAWRARAGAVAAFYGGDTERTIALYEDSIRFFDESGDVRVAAQERANLAHSMLAVGLNEEAERVLRESLATAARLGLDRLRATGEQNLGAVLARLGRLDEARAAELRAIAVFQALKNVRMEGGSRVYLAMILLASGAIEEASAEAEQAARELVVAPPIRVDALAHLARIRLAQGRTKEALDVAGEAIKLAMSLSAAGATHALARLAHAEALAATGDVAAAREAIASARARLVERARRLENPAWAEAFLRAIPEHARTLELAERAGLIRD